MLKMMWLSISYKLAAFLNGTCLRCSPLRTAVTFMFQYVHLFVTWIIRNIYLTKKERDMDNIYCTSQGSMHDTYTDGRMVVPLREHDTAATYIT